MVRVFGAGWDHDDVAGAHRQHLAGHAQGARALQDDEHLLLRQVVVVGATALAWRQDIEARTELLGRHAVGDATAHRVVQRRSFLALEPDFVGVADQPLTQCGGGRGFRHGSLRRCAAIFAPQPSLTIAAR